MEVVESKKKRSIRLRMVRQRFSKIELKERMHRSRFVVPNAVTLSNMFCGFIAIVYASTNRFDKTVIAIGIALLLDGLDGRVARRLKATSKFGLEFDSFSDLVSFGLAPALAIYHWSFRPFADEFGVLVCFIYAMCAASRLARFNIQAENLKSFTGLPTPGAAGMVMAYMNFAPPADPSVARTVFDSVLMIVLAALMVSRIEFLSIKKLKGSRAELFLLIGVLIALLWYNSRIGFLCLASGYVLSGPALLIARRCGWIKHPSEEDSSLAI